MARKLVNSVCQVHRGFSMQRYANDQVVKSSYVEHERRREERRLKPGLCVHRDAVTERS